MRATTVRGGLTLLLAATILGAPHGLAARKPPSVPQGLFIMYSANAPREAPSIFRRYFIDRDYARSESLPSDVPVARKHRYVLPTTLRRRWAGEPGLRHWIDRGCGPRTPGTIVYDPEERYLTPRREQHHFIGSVRRAAQLVNSTGCHQFGLAPGASLLFAMNDTTCSYDLRAGFYRDIRWKSVDIIDIQNQRFLGDHCFDERGVEKYAALTSSLAAYVRERNPDISVVSQVSFRDSPPSNMKEGIASVLGVIDGIYFSYPSVLTDIPCRYCSPANLETLLDYLRS